MRELKRIRAKFDMKTRGMVQIFKNGGNHNRYGTKKRRTRVKRKGVNAPVSHFARHWREFGNWPLFMPKRRAS